MKAAAFSDAGKVQRFREGVTALFDIWDALVMVRTEMVAGRDTVEIVEDMLEGILEQFTFGPKGKARVSQADLEDMIFDFTSRDLNTVLEDGSVEQVADYCFQLHRTLAQDNVSVYDKLLAAAAKKKKMPPQKHTVIEPEKSEGGVEGEEAADDDSGESGGSEEEGDGEEDKEEKAKEKDKKKNEPDEDGWVTVGKKK